MRIVVKVGSNVLARKDGTLDVTRMSALVDQMAELHKQNVQIILVSSGAVASGRSEMKGRVEAGKLDAVSQRQLFSAVGQAKLVNKYYNFFRDHGIACGQVLTTKESLGTRQQYLNQKNCMEVMLDEGVIPIVNENDTISLQELMFTDNDELSGLIATMMSAGMLIILSNIDGIYTGNPSDPDARLIPVVRGEEDLTQYIHTSKSSFGRGGMVTKYRIARKVASEGVNVVIANGKRDNILPELVEAIRQSDATGEAPACRCTLFSAAPREVSSVKRWIAHSEDFSKGALVLNAAAAEVVRGEKAVSILPVGVAEVRGSFEKHDIVRIVDEAGNQLGVGRVDCDSEKARTLLGKRGQKPLVHYDYLVLDE